MHIYVQYVQECEENYFVSTYLRKLFMSLKRKVIIDDSHTTQANLDIRQLSIKCSI